MNQTMECEAAQQLFEAISLDLKQGAKLAVEGAFGYSRYHSLQAAEKALKAFIAAKGAPVRKIHVLKDLHECAVGAGMRPLSTQWLQSTQCSAGVRYGEENSTSADAFEAHSAARMIVFEVAHQLPRKQKQS
jgi:HEPN domain